MPASAPRQRTSLMTFVSLSALMGLLLAGLSLPFAGAIGFGAKALAESAEDLPKLLDAENLAQRTEVLDRRGNVIATFFDQNRINVSLSEVAPIMREALIAIEDQRFYEHGAMDLKGTLRALITNQLTGTIAQGGSTLTQQMVKMTLLNQAETEAEQRAATADTYARKLQELRYAIGFEQNYSKDWILERYLNIAYFGDGTYGVKSASLHYFSKEPSELTAREAALLAGLVKNPVGYDPIRFPDRALARRNTVLRKMASVGVISQSEANRLTKTQLGLNVTESKNGCLGSKAPFFCDYVRRYLMADEALGATPKDRAQFINAGGLTIKTTLAPAFQRAADQATRDAVYPTDNAIAGLAMVEPGTGEVRALSQSRPMGRNAKEGETFLNYVVDSEHGDANGFQAGSTFKVFVLAAALRQGIPPSIRINAPQQISIPQNRFEDCDGPYDSNTPWEPKNAGGSGNHDLYSGTYNSVNTFYAQLAAVVGLCEPYNLAKRMGVQLTDPASERVPSFTLGVADVSPLEMAGAYATFAARGIHCANRPVTEILNRDGEVFKEYNADCSRVLDENVADTVNDILTNVLTRGTAARLGGIGRPAAGKTGTINSNRAVWFNGYTPTLSTSAMIAGANQQGHWVSLNGQTLHGRYVSTAYGGTYAGPMWKQAVTAVLDNFRYAEFVRPGPITPGKGVKRVPALIGVSVNHAKALLEKEGFLVQIGPAQRARQPKGTVADMSPGAGTTTLTGAVVRLIPSKGIPTRRIPDFRGVHFTTSRYHLQKAGFRVTTRAYPNSALAKGMVATTSPGAGSEAEVGSTVVLYLSTGGN